MIPGMELAEGIANALELLEAAKEHVREQMKIEQIECAHTFIVEDGGMNAGSMRRICVRCRLEETGSYQSDFKALKRSEDRLMLTPAQVNKTSITSLRLPA